MVVICAWFFYEARPIEMRNLRGVMTSVVLNTVHAGVHHVIRWTAGLLVLGMLASCGSGEERVVDGKLQLRFGEGCYRIPEWNAQLVHASPFLTYSARDSNRFLRLQFTSEVLARDVPGFLPSHNVQGNLVEGVRVSLFLRTPEEIARDDANRESMHHDIWYGLGDYAGRKIEPVPGTSFFRVYPGGTWMVVTQRPDEQRQDTHLNKGFWIGTCYLEEATGESVCSTDVERGELTVDFSTREENLALRDRIAAYAQARLDEWRVPCGSN